MLSSSITLLAWEHTSREEKAKSRDTEISLQQTQQIDDSDLLTSAAYIISSELNSSRYRCLRTVKSVGAACFRTNQKNFASLLNSMRGILPEDWRNLEIVAWTPTSNFSGATLTLSHQSENGETTTRNFFIRFSFTKIYDLD